MSAPPGEASAVEPVRAPSDLAGRGPRGRGSGWRGDVCERPLLDGSATAEGFLTIEGWAYFQSGIEGVFVYLDGLRFRARYGIFRLDLRELFGADAARTGLILTIELSELQRGRLDLAVVATAGNGRAVGTRGIVDCRPPTTPPHGPEPSEVDPFGAIERFVPEDSPGTLIEVEHLARYRWSAPAVRAPPGPRCRLRCRVRHGAANASGRDVSRRCRHGCRGDPTGPRAVRPPGRIRRR